MCPVGWSHALAAVLWEDFKLWINQPKIRWTLYGVLTVKLAVIIYWIATLVR